LETSLSNRFWRVVTRRPTRRLEIGLALALLSVVAACAPTTGEPPTPTDILVTATQPPVIDTPVVALTATSSAATATLDTTKAYLVGRKATAAAQLGQTAAAQPGVTSKPPTPTLEAGLPPCRAADLQLGTQAQGATGTSFIGVQITNTSPAACSLQGPPDIKLVSGTGQPLDVVYRLACLECGGGAASPTAPAATQTAAAHEVLYAQLALQPGERLGVSLVWQNWCGAFPPSGVRLRLTLPDGLGVVDGPAIGGRCDVPGTESTVGIGPFVRLP
jgi:hypothetical protein